MLGLPGSTKQSDGTEMGGKHKAEVSQQVKSKPTNFNTYTRSQGEKVVLIVGAAQLKEALSEESQ